MAGLQATPISGNAPELRAALEAAGLPVDDLQEPGRVFFGFTVAGRPVAYGGLEVVGDAALVRSIAVLPEARGFRPRSG